MSILRLTFSPDIYWKTNNVGAIHKLPAYDNMKKDLHDT
ncbi:MAG: hypothetical protein ACI8Q2_000816 [Candidatus Omnitrophota bacterium]|jgi:hypothetical protein